MELTEENYEELHDAFERWSDAEYERENESEIKVQGKTPKEVVEKPVP